MIKLRWIVLFFGLSAILSSVWAGLDRPTEFTNQGGVINTRHNFTMRDASGADLLRFGPNAGGAVKMADNITNYGEVCVYCHTPHGADTSAAMPLWNRKIKTTTYTTYNQLNTTSLTQTVNQPGAASLPCLSCHDGQQAIDAIRNMPGSGGYQATPDNTFLDTFRDATGQGGGLHSQLNYGGDNCLNCHAPGAFSNATDLSTGFIGTDLRNDHPVGVTYPAVNGAGTDWKTPNGNVVRGTYTTSFFDTNINGRMDKGEIRLYDSGNGPSVECASCHDPHGVPSAGVGSQFNPTFLRKTNVGSAVCMTCHAK